MKLSYALLLCLFTFAAADSFSQRPKDKFGDVKPQDFTPSAYAVDSSANAVILFDIGSSSYDADIDGGLAVVFKRHTRIRLLNHNAFDLADRSISMFVSNGFEEKIQSFQAATYNIENGKVQATKVDRASLFQDKVTKNYVVKKFTMPALKEGSIIEIQYELKTPYDRWIRPWNFQGTTPVLWSEYEVTIPEFYDFVFLNQGYRPYDDQKSETGNTVYNVYLSDPSGVQRREMVRVPANTRTQSWVMKNVPALKKESFTTTIDNHISKIEFVLRRLMYPQSAVKDVLGDWFMLSKGLMEDEDFGKPLTQNTGFWKDEIKTLTAGSTTPLDSAKKIFAFVRDNITCSRHEGKYLTNPPKKVYQLKNGNVADVNLLLTTLLLNCGFEAHPTLLSTRDNGKPLDACPLVEKMNYVICQLKIGDKQYLLDASHSKLGFGKLPEECYNGSARVIDKEMPVLIDLSADSLQQSRLTTVFMTNEEKGGVSGTFTCTFSDQESTDLRDKLSKTSLPEYFKDLKKGFLFDLEMSNTAVESLKSYEDPVKVKYNFKFNANDDVIYLNPIFQNDYTENPFKAAERQYPVEMPYAVNETYIMKMDIPKGYAVEEVPKSSRVLLNEDEGMFEYIIEKDASYIQLRSTIRINKANFSQEDYSTLRDFFGYIVKKNSEQIVFKKIKS